MPSAATGTLFLQIVEDDDGFDRVQLSSNHASVPVVHFNF